MELQLFRKAAGILPSGNAGSAQQARRRRSFLLPIFSASLAIGVAVVAVGARNQNADHGENQGREVPPYWAYAVDPPARSSHPKSVDNTLRHVPGSTAAFTERQINDAFSPPDWHPAGHPTMPEIVAHGRKPKVMACGYCHLPNGQGRPENASLAGLPTTYILQQMVDFKSGRRKTSNPKFLPAVDMAIHESLANQNEVREAARYFSRLKPKPWIRVIETATVPKTQVAGWMLVPTAGGGREPIGHRIIETPVNVGLTEMRDDASSFIAYVPEGSIERGRKLASTGGAGITIACDTCHGPDLRGISNVPSIAGRSPSYIIRQLYDMQTGARSGADMQLMKPVVGKLSLGDMVSLAAYLASLHP